MVRYGKFCRAGMTILALGLLPSMVHGLDLRFSNPFSWSSGIFSFGSGNGKVSQQTGADEMDWAEVNTRYSSRATNYLTASRTMQVIFVSAEETSPAAPASSAGREFSSFSDFRKRLEADPMEKDAPTEIATTAKPDSAESSPAHNGAGGHSTGLVTGSRTIAQSGETRAGDRVVIQAGPPSGPQITSSGGPGQRLFQRRGTQQEELADLLLFFPTQPFDFETSGNYNLLESGRRIDLFTAPSQPLPRSSARLRTVPGESQ